MKIIATGLPATIEDYQVALNAAFAGGEAFGKAQQRTWIGLTNEEVKDALRKVMHSDTNGVVRTIEAKLKAKNFA